MPLRNHLRRHASSRVHVNDACRHPPWLLRTPLPCSRSDYSARSIESKPPNTTHLNNASLVSSKQLTGVICLYGVSITFAKLSILSFLLRIFPSTMFRWSVYSLMFLTCCYCIESILVVCFWCKPVAYSWDKTIAGGTCINQLAFFRYNTIPNILIDVVMLLLPLPLVWKLQTSTTQKLGLTAIFLTGIV